MTRVSRYTSQACIVYRLGKPNIVSCTLSLSLSRSDVYFVVFKPVFLLFIPPLPVPNQQRTTLNKLPPELQCRNNVTKHRLSLQIGAKGANCNVCIYIPTCMVYGIYHLYVCKWNWPSILHTTVGGWACVSCIDSCIAILLPYRLVYRLGKKFWISHSLIHSTGTHTCRYST